ncbi:MAG TPA: flagellar FliJ family protein [Candidatus Sulfopaludibacter sp.]|nr:flagellar FliJ family protein [Candidatus Sulfopaludibacter sp.]
MKPFRFPLEPLRVMRGQKERAAQVRYADALRACERAAAEVKAAGDELNTSWLSLSRGLSAGVTALELLRTRAWCNVLELRLKERADQLIKARLVVDTVWQQMLAATRDREALDRFHRKSRRVYQHDWLQTEQKQFDELAVQTNGEPGWLQPPNSQIKRL